MAMTEAKLREVIEALRKKVAYPPLVVASNNKEEVAHLQTMPDKMLGFLAEGRREKLMRWIGFMQGALWMMGMDLEALKRMNMPDEEKT